MVERRTPRAHLSQQSPGVDPQTLPPVSPVLVEWLEREFPVRLSGLPGFGDPINAEIVLTDQARQMGQQEVLNRLRSLSQNNEG